MLYTTWDSAYKIRSLLVTLLIALSAPFFIIGCLALFDAAPLFFADPVLPAWLGYGALTAIFISLCWGAYATRKFFVRLALSNVACSTLCYSILPLVIERDAGLESFFFVLLLPLGLAVLTCIITVVYLFRYTHKPFLVVRELSITLLLAVLFILITLWYLVDTVDEDALLALAFFLFIISWFLPLPAVSTACLIEGLALIVLLWWYISALIEELFGPYALVILGVSFITGLGIFLWWYDDTDKN